MSLQSLESFCARSYRCRGPLRLYMYLLLVSLLLIFLLLLLFPTSLCGVLTFWGSPAPSSFPSSSSSLLFAHSLIIITHSLTPTVHHHHHSPRIHSLSLTHSLTPSHCFHCLGAHTLRKTLNALSRPTPNATKRPLQSALLDAARASGRPPSGKDCKRD